ncbi:mast cell protease 1A isoform X2 [Fundulus heteroclitus]|nr:mast cell protease 1A isoform X2 [Fundulus heteroclitus]
MALVVRSDLTSCGGFLVSKDFVLTAAHCKSSSYNVCVGMNKYHDQKKSCFSVEQDFPHEKYNNETYANDIMLLKLATRAVFNENVKPITMANNCESSVPKMCLVSGWGKTSEDEEWQSSKLMEVNVTLIDNEICAEEKVYCSEGKKGPGQGDSGGPLVCEDGKAYGVVSASTKPSSDSMVYKYTKIPDYRMWIDEIMKLY